ncbi:MAG TPA: hypothetical protein VHO69_03065 [Phototrophicaceae bacterium]|nr:hypothetical protein [Phototrophicaceae bacterium]
MSLTCFLKCQGVETKFRETFPLPHTSSPDKMLAVPLTKNYSLVGTAFDYLLRFYLERLYPSEQSKSWIAEAALDCSILQNNEAAQKQAQTIVQTARELQATYLQSGQITDKLLRACLLLAQVDPIFRRNVIVSDFGKIDECDVVDLRNLIKV